MSEEKDKKTGDDFLTYEDWKKRWKNRRKMAWLSLSSMILITFILICVPIPVDRLKVLVDLVVWYYGGCVGVVFAYMGFTTWGYMKSLKG